MIKATTRETHVLPYTSQADMAYESSMLVGAVSGA